MLYLCSANEKADPRESAFFVFIGHELALGKEKIALRKFEIGLLEVSLSEVSENFQLKKLIDFQFNDFLLMILRASFVLHFSSSISKALEEGLK